jgi:hypothetical protein
MAEVFIWRLFNQVVIETQKAGPATSSERWPTAPPPPRRFGVGLPPRVLERFDQGAADRVLEAAEEVIGAA